MVWQPGPVPLGMSQSIYYWVCFILGMSHFHWVCFKVVIFINGLSFSYRCRICIHRYMNNLLSFIDECKLK